MFRSLLPLFPPDTEIVFSPYRLASVKFFPRRVYVVFLAFRGCPLIRPSRPTRDDDFGAWSILKWAGADYFPTSEVACPFFVNRANRTQWDTHNTGLICRHRYPILQNS